jgi:hypothetical protein
MKAEVRVSKAGGASGPIVEVALDPKATPDQIASAIRSVYSNPVVYRNGGVRECLTCKSGIHVQIVESYSDSIIVDTDK